MKIVIKKTSGGVSIMTLVGDADPAECIAKWSDANPGEYVSHREMPDDAIPVDRTFRNAWTDTTPEPMIDIDPVRAAQISNPVPESVTMRQARLALLGAGLLDTVNSAIASMPGAAGESARLEWEFSSEVQRNKTFVVSMASALGLSNAQLDALFIQAAAL
ncbi:MAG: hypothetical protein WC100_00945 [Sterolibacterium sp.]